MKIDLWRPRLPAWRPEPIVIIKRSLPFVESGAGRYTHRVKSAVLVELKGYPSHIGVHCWCGMHLNLSHKLPSSAFVEEPSGRPICATCEGRAIGAGQLGAREIAGRPVMFSPVVMRRTCG